MGGGAGVRRAQGAVDDLAAFGLTTSLAPPEVIELDPTCEPSVRVWLRAARCWRSGFGGAEGLDWAQLRVIADALAAPLTEAVIDDLQILEDETLALLDERRRQDEARRGR